MDRNLRTLVAIIIVLIAAVSRLAPHPVNFTPIIALALFGGVILGRSVWGFALPVVAMLVTDIYLGFHVTTPVVYGSLLLITALGVWLPKPESKLGTLSTWMGGCLGGSILFFLLTNAAVWALTPMYVKSIEGLWQSYVMGLPFYKNTLYSTGIYFFAMMGAMKMAEQWLPSKVNS